MNFINNLRIGVRLGLGFGLVILAALFIAVFGRLSLGQLQDQAKSLSGALVKVDQVRDLQDNLNAIGRAARNMILVSDAQRIAQENGRINDARKSNGELIDKLEASITSDKGKVLLKEMSDKRAPYNAVTDKMLAHIAAGEKAEATAMLMGEVAAAQVAYATAMSDLTKYQQKLAQDTETEVAAEVASSGLMMLVVAAIAGALGVFIAWLVTVSVTRPLNEAVGITDRIADGDLTATIRATSTDEVGHLLSSLQKMQANLQKIVGEVRTGVDSVSTASQQIAAGNQDLSSRTEEQASNLQQTAASMEQLAPTVRQNTETAKQANTLAASASTAAAKGGNVVGEVVSTMEGISAASHKIADIINVIDGIAFQTNILALNAAVEAARAGEQGRGFAVVAGEVRNLAQRSAQAAREIKSLISDSVEKVDAGGKLVHQAGDAMQDIVAQVKRVSDLIGEITSATLEQNSGIGQVNNAVTQLDQVTQQNAALVEESAAAAESMKAQAHKLAQSVSVFRLSQAQAHEVIAQAQSAARSGAARVEPRVEPRAKAAPAAKPARAAAPAARRPAAVTPAADAGGDWKEF